jgi:hypothetical protein
MSVIQKTTFPTKWSSCKCYGSGFTAGTGLPNAFFVSSHKVGLVAAFCGVPDNRWHVTEVRVLPQVSRASL